MRWRDRAACRGKGNASFFTQCGFAAAKAVCAICEVRGECLDAAMMWELWGRGRFRFGVWGGLTPLERTRLALTDPRYHEPVDPSLLEEARSFEEELGVSRIVQVNVAVGQLRVGEDVELDDDEARPLIASGYVTPIDGRDDASVAEPDSVR